MTVSAFPLRSCCKHCDAEQPLEIQANALARNLLIPNEVWKAERDHLLTSHRDHDVIAVAERVEISSAIIAGRIRWETGDYTLFSRLIGSQSVRRLFADYEPGVSKHNE